MFRMTAMLGWNSTVLSSWKLETSITDQVSGVLSSMSPTTGTPMLPHTRVGTPDSLRISPSRAVVVVFPLEPVMATVLPRRKRAASSSSPMTGRPKFFTCTSSGVSRGTPGLTTIRSWRRKVSRPWPPASTMMPSSIKAGISLASASALRMSETVTCAPRRRRNNAAARPDFPSPTTRTFLPFKSIPIWLLRSATLFYLAPRGPCLTQFQGGECKQCKHQGGDPEANDDFGFAPAQLFEVVMQRGHLEDTLLVPQLV